jgi:hypothetical protein
VVEQSFGMDSRLTRHRLLLPEVNHAMLLRLRPKKVWGRILYYEISLPRILIF